MHLILCDAINSGKSSAVMDLAVQLRARGIAFSGWITPAHMEGSLKTGHDFVLIENGTMNPPIPFTRQTSFDGSFLWRRFYFNLRAFELAGDLKPAAELFVMDEIGPMELENQSGFLGIARRALAKSPATLTVLRKGIERSFLSFAPSHKFSFLSLDQIREMRDFTLSDRRG